MDEARLGADDFRQMGREGDYVVLGLALDLVDPGDVEAGVFGLGPDWFVGGLALRSSRRVGQAFGIGSDSGGQDVALQAGNTLSG